MIIENLNYLLDVTLVVVISIVLFFVEKYIVQRVFLKKKLQSWQFYFLKAIDKPLKSLIVLISLTFIIEIFCKTHNSILISENFYTIKLIIVLSILTWSILSFIKRLEKHFLKYNSFSSHKDKDIKKSTIILVMKLCFTTTTVIAVIILLQIIGVKMQAIITFVSLSGVAIGIASKDLTAGLFGTMMIYISRPFSIGDRIKCSNIEGFVENITWISTRIRLDSKKLVYIPNIQFLTSNIENATECIEKRLVIVIDVFHSNLTFIKSVFEDYRTSIKNSKILYNDQEDIERDVYFEILEIQEIKVTYKCKCYFNKYITQAEFHLKKELLANIMTEIFNKHNIRFSCKFEE